MMNKLKECKSFAELFEVIGEENFGEVAKLLIAVLIASPLFWGIINYSMLIDVTSYNAYSYNDKCISLMHALFSIITLWSFLYYFGRIRYEKWSVKQIILQLKENNPWLLFWFALAIWTIVPVAFSEFPLGAITGATFLSSGYITHIYMLGIMGCAAMVPAKSREDIFKSFVIIADILALIVIAFEYEIPIIGHFAASGGMSVYTNQNHYAYYMTLACMIMVGGYYKSIVYGASNKDVVLYLGSFVLNIYVLMINDTMGAYLGIVFACIIMVIVWWQAEKRIGIKTFLPIAIIAVITIISYVGIIPPSRTWIEQTTIGQSLTRMFADIFKVAKKADGYQNAGSTRWGVWMDAIDWIMKRPITGYGPDIMYNSAMEKFRDTPHNEYIECAFYLGIPGLVLYLGGLFTLLFNKCKKIKEISVNMLIAGGASIAYLISAFFGVRKFNSVCFFFLFMGFLISNKKENTK